MNFKESRPIYLQIADRIMDEIQRGVYPEGGRIPSVREYAAIVEVNANTAMRSYDYLQNKGIIAVRNFSTRSFPKCSVKSARSASLSPK